MPSIRRYEMLAPDGRVVLNAPGWLAREITIACNATSPDGPGYDYLPIGRSLFGHRAPGEPPLTQLELLMRAREER